MRYVILCVGMVIATLYPLSADAKEVIHDFISQIEVRPDGTLQVSEIITANAEHDKIKHGIYRDLPRARRTEFGGYLATSYNDIKVMVDGRPCVYRAEYRGNMLRIWIGDPNTFIPYGDHAYTISYTVANQTRSKDGYDELTWNITGNGWLFPIASVTSTVMLPSGASVEDIHAYTGRAGEKGIQFTGEKHDNKAIFKTSAPLGPKEGLTVYISWPKGYVATSSSPLSNPTFMDEHPGVVETFAGLILICLFYYVVWVQAGRDPPARALTPFYDPPKDISPAMAYQIMEMGLGNKVQAFTSAIISIASKGYIVIDEVGAKEYMITRTDKRETQLLSEDERTVYYGLDSGIIIGKKTKGKLDGLMKEHADVIKYACSPAYYIPNVYTWGIGLIIPLLSMFFLFVNLREDAFPLCWSFLLGAGVTAYVYRATLLFQNRSGNFWTKSLTDMIFPALMLCLFRNELADIFLNGAASFLTEFMAILAGGIVAAAFFLMRAPTIEGRDAMDHIAGLRYYMSMVEEKVLKKFDPPEMSRELYEKYLPYACALGVDSKWGNKFALSVAGAGLAASGYYGPHWYSSSSGMSSGGFSMSSMMNDFSSSMAATSGGSGGGGGGGGGGGW